DGPLRIDAERDEAVFEGNVAIFQASPDAPLEPPEELPANRFECEGLRLQLDPETRRFTRAIAERGARPVRCYLEGDYQVAGDRLEWSEGDAEALLSGNLRIHGELGEFRARRARIYLRENRSVLEDEVRGHLRGATLSETGGGGEDPWGERLASDWNLEADEAEILHGGGEGRSQLRLFRATSRLPNGVVIREARQDGAVLRGSTIAYDPEQDALTVGALSGREAIRPHFREGRNEIRSQHIQLALSRSELVFTNHVEAIIYDIPAGAVRELPKAFRERRRNDHTSLRCTRLRLAWDPLHRLQELEAWAGETPLILRNEGVDSYSLQGETLRWQAQQGRITLSGAPGEQSLTLQGQARLRAGELRFSVERWMAIGDGGVIAEIERQAILGGRPRGESRQVRVQSDHLEIHFRRPQEPRKKMEKGERAPSKAPVVSARGWSDGGGAVEIADGLLRAQGEELIWRTEAGELLLRGSGRQRIFHLGPGGTDEISAQSIIFREAERKVLLEGEARASLHLVNLGKDAATIAGGGDQAWDLTAGHLEVLLDEVTEEKVAGGTGPRRRLALREVRARDGVTLSHPEEEITFQGAGCEWSHERMRLRVFSPDGQGYQTLYRGSERKDEFVAREITVVRPPERKRDPRDRLLIYAQEVLRATFHREQKGEPRPDVPDTFRLIADNLLLELEMEPAGVDRASRGASKASSAVKEAHAWGNVTFTGEPFKLIAHQAVYLPREQRVVFRGRGSQRVQILSEQGSGFPPSKEVEVFWTTKGYRIRSVPRGFPWHIDDLERDLKLLDQRERTPRE
ncbi:MAG: hypothetical protein ACE5GW_01060, partial [Planctomycetota bacterium]